MADPMVDVKEDPELPPYSSPTERTTHSYQLTEKHGHAWITLKVRSSWPSSPETLPRLVEGQPVEGSVSVDLPAEKDIKLITVSVVGELISEPNIRFSFVDVTHEIWSPEKGDPSLVSGDSVEGTGNGSPTPFKGKLHGKFSWPFSLHLPETVELEENGAKKSFRLPSHTYTRWGRSDVMYRVTVKISFKSFLRPDLTLGTNVGFVPLIRPSAPSSLRELAYEHRTPLPGPDVDPEGWHSLQPVTISGKIFDERHVTVNYTLALAKPLCYTRGTVIPLHLTVQSTDSQALGLLSAPTAPLVRLRRITRDNYDAGGFGDASVLDGKERHLSDLKPIPMMKFQDLVGYVNTATWWSTPSLSNDPNTRTLQGEIHLLSSTRPNLHIGLFKYFHDIALFSPQAPRFVPETKKDGPWQTEGVEVATMHAVGPRVVAYSPPTYQEEKHETRGAQFNKFTGLDLNY